MLGAADRFCVEAYWLGEHACVLAVKMNAPDGVCGWVVGTRSSRDRLDSPDNRPDLDSDRSRSCDRSRSFGGSLGRGGSRCPRSSRDSQKHSSRSDQRHALQHSVGDSWLSLAD